MLRRIMGTTVAALLLMTLAQGVADAKQPLDVDCDDLAAALIAVDAILDANEAQFASLGELVSQSKKDPVLFATLQGLTLFVSGGTVAFTTPQEVVPTIGKCGLVPLLIELIGT